MRRWLALALAAALLLSGCAGKQAQTRQAVYLDVFDTVTTVAAVGMDEADFQQAYKEITALEEQTIKALTGENSIDVSIINAMMPKYKEKRDAAQRRLEEANANMEREKATNRAAVTQVSNLMEWADLFDKANKETRHMILARLIDRVEVGAGYKVTVKFKITYEQFLGTAA